MNKKRLILIVMDGWGIAEPNNGNCVHLAKKPNYDYYIANFPFTKLEASGEYVGLPAGSQGNSEVGHLHIGAGRVVWQPYELINREIRSGNFFKNKVLLEAIRNCKKNKSNLHIMGLCSDEGVHATTYHLLALLDLAKKEDFKNVYVHFFADGRDVPERSALKYVKQIEDKFKEIGFGQIASVVGRYYAMDRDKNWDRTKQAYELLTLGVGHKANNAKEAIEKAYERGDRTDYYIEPTVIVNEKGEPLATIKNNDSVIFFNFRTDRPKQLCHAFLDDEFNHFERNIWPKTFFVTFTQYEENLNCKVAFEIPEVKNNLGELLSKNGYLQLRIAETEKYAHVTYFFNSQIEEPYPNEERVMIPSLKLQSYDVKPEMSAYEIAEETVKRINSLKYDFILVNFANCDLVGHSAVLTAVIKAVETVDDCVGKIVNAALEKDYICVITADHGSAEDKLYPNGEPKPSHSTNPVPFIIVSKDPNLKNLKLKEGSLIDVAPTILKILKIKKPREMEGKPLF
ncbi:MAG: 2,3-bisphosphoglycerate-independent phosphoglycerate mutase [Candidatus Diapherotrites archaeon]|nr:2,3-bisphosphoglycerate-independent phosphoglycerate mutase [Candidatus Diapherotrites archaeon]